MICPVCCRHSIGDYTAVLASHHELCPAVFDSRAMVLRVRSAVHDRSLVGAFTTYSDRTIGLRGRFSADDLRALADALDGKPRRTKATGESSAHRRARSSRDCEPTPRELG